MEDLMQSQNDLVLRRIFLSLDPASLHAASQVSCDWLAYVRRIWDSQSGRRVLERRLDHQWRLARPLSRSLKCQAAVFHIEADEKDYVISLENGTIEVWDRTSHTLRATLTVPHPHQPSNPCGHGVRLGLHADFIAAGFFTKRLHVWHRRRRDSDSDSDLDSLEGFAMDVASNVHDVKVTLNWLLVSMVSGTVDVFRWTAEDSLDRVFQIEGHSRTIHLMSCDSEHVLTRSHRHTLQLWHLGDQRLVKDLTSSLFIQSISLKHSMALVAGYGSKNLIFSQNQLELWSLEAGEGNAQLVRCLKMDQIIPRLTLFDGKRMVVFTKDHFSVFIVKDFMNEEQPTEHGIGEKVSLESDLVKGRLEEDKLIYQAGEEGLVRVDNFWLGREEDRRRGESGDSGRSLVNSRLVKVVNALVGRQYHWLRTVIGAIRESLGL